MTSEQFGQLALQLLNASQIPGGALEQALSFRDMAKGLATGELSISKPEPYVGEGIVTGFDETSQ